MAFIDEAAQLIKAQLDQLDAEERHLERVLGALHPDSVPGRPGSRPMSAPSGAESSKTAGKPGRTKVKAARIPRADREQAILTFLKGHPSATSKEIAAGVGTTANYVNNMLSGLRKQGRLVRKADRTQVEIPVGASDSSSKAAAAKSPGPKKPGRKNRGGRDLAKRGSTKAAAEK